MGLNINGPSDKNITYIHMHTYTFSVPTLTRPVLVFFSGIAIPTSIDWELNKAQFTK